jgi:hypothetical protein
MVKHKKGDRRGREEWRLECAHLVWKNVFLFFIWCRAHAHAPLHTPLHTLSSSPSQTHLWTHTLARPYTPLRPFLFSPPNVKHQSKSREPTSQEFFKPRKESYFTTNLLFSSLFNRFFASTVWGTQGYKMLSWLWKLFLAPAYCLELIVIHNTRAWSSKVGDGRKEGKVKSPESDGIGNWLRRMEILQESKKMHNSCKTEKWNEVWDNPSEGITIFLQRNGRHLKKRKTFEVIGREKKIFF